MRTISELRLAETTNRQCYIRSEKHFERDDTEMIITERVIKEFPKLRELLPLFNPRQVKVIRRDEFNSQFIMLEDSDGNGYIARSGIIYVVKPT